MTFFNEVGKAVCAQLGTARTSALTRTALNSHLSGPRIAHDAMPRGMRRGGRDADLDDLPPRGEERYSNGNGGTGNGGPYAFGGGAGGDGSDPDDANCIDAESCTLFVKKLVLGLAPDERDKFLENLASMMQSDDATQWAGGGGPNASAMDRRGGRSGRRSARDNYGGTPSSMPMDRRRQAQDSNTTMLNQKDFDSRWGDLTRKIEVWG